MLVMVLWIFLLHFVAFTAYSV